LNHPGSSVVAIENASITRITAPCSGYHFVSRGEVGNGVRAIELNLCEYCLLLCQKLLNGVYKKLRKLIDYHRILYQTFDQPQLSDAAFDALKNELEELERTILSISTKTLPLKKSEENR
jgi:hypothetical protein